MIRKCKAAEDIEAQLAALEAQLRREKSLETEIPSEMPAFADSERELQELAGD